MSTIPQNNRVTSFAIDREYDYIMYDTTDMIRAMNFPREIAGLFLKTDEFHLSLFEVLGEYGVDEAGYEQLEQLSCTTGAAMTTEPELTGEFCRLVDNAKGRETIIALVQWAELEAWRDAIRELIPQAEFIIPHVTLYTDHNGAIGYSDRDAYRAQPLDAAIKATLYSVYQKRKEVECNHA